MLSYQADIEAAGGTIVFRTPVLEAAIDGHAVKLRTGGVEPAELEALLVVNATGLDAWDFSSRVTGLDTATIPARYLAKGSYFGLTGKAPFRHLIYPVPEPGGLGIHLTLDLAGQGDLDPTWNGSIELVTMSIHSAADHSMPRSAATGPGFTTAR